MVASRMSTQTQQRRAWWFAPFVLLLAGGGVVFAYAATGGAGVDSKPLPVVAGSCLLAAIMIFLRVRRGDAWRSAPSLGFGILAMALVSLTLQVTEASGPDPPHLNIFDIAFMATGALFLVAVAIEFREHVP